MRKGRDGKGSETGGGSKGGESKQEMGAGWFFPTAVSMALFLLPQGPAVWLTAQLCPGSSQRDVGGPLFLFPRSDRFAEEPVLALVSTREQKQRDPKQTSSKTQLFKSTGCVVKTDCN